MTPLRLTAAALLLAAITTTYGTPPATAQPKSFAGFTELAYGTPRTMVAKTLAAAGYTFDSIGHYNDDLYIGNVDGLRTDLFSYYDDHGDVAKITVNYETADADAHETYNRMRQDLITRFGPPRMTYAFYKRPYTASDDLRALQSGNGFFSSYWTQPDGSARMFIEITRKLTVQITYEGPQWTRYVRSLHRT